MSIGKPRDRKVSGLPGDEEKEELGVTVNKRVLFGGGWKYSGLRGW
jgi:hypothetical protein